MFGKIGIIRGQKSYPAQVGHQARAGRCALQIRAHSAGHMIAICRDADLYPMQHPPSKAVVGLKYGLRHLDSGARFIIVHKHPVARHQSKALIPEMSGDDGLGVADTLKATVEQMLSLGRKADK